MCVNSVVFYFQENSLIDDDLLLLSGYECFRFPLDHLKYYVRAIAEINSTGTNPAPVIIFRCVEILQMLCARIDEVSKVQTIRGLDLFLPSLGTYLMSGEFAMRDYMEGQVHNKTELYLFTEGVLVAKQKGLTLLHRLSDLEYDSFYSMDHIELDTDCIRLKDPTSKLTVYKIMERKRGLLKWDIPKALPGFLEHIGNIQQIFNMPMWRSSDMNYDLGDLEAINIKYLEDKKFPGNCGRLKAFASERVVRVSRNKTATFVEVFNLSLCNTEHCKRHNNQQNDQDLVVLRNNGSPQEMWRRLFKGAKNPKITRRWTKY